MDVQRGEPGWSALRKTLEPIVAGSYERLDDILDPGIERANLAYLGRRGGRVVSFFFVTWDDPPALAPCAYLGLSASHEDARGERAREIFKDLRPTPDAGPWDDDLPRLEAIADSLGHSFDPQRPHLFRGLSPARYSATERQRQRVSGRHRVVSGELADVDERAGDRLVCLAWPRGGG